MPKRQYWLIKSEPGSYPFSQLESERKTAWTGVRNFEARNNIRQMKPGDLLLYYHSGEGKEIVGVAKVLTAPAADPTAPKEDWASVDVGPVIPLSRPVGLAEIKKTPAFAGFSLVKKSRLSVGPVTPEEFERVLKLGKTKLP